MNISIKFKDLFNFLALFGLISVPLGIFLPRTLLLIIYFCFILILIFLSLNKSKISNWLLLFLSLLYILFFIFFRPDSLLYALRLSVIIFTILIASYYSLKCNNEDLLKLIKITFLIGLFSAIYGLKQYFFGYSDFDMAVLKTLGSGGALFDLEYFNKYRSLGITYGAISQGILLGWTIHCIIFLNYYEKRLVVKCFYIFSILIVLISLIATQNRTSIISLLLSMVIYLNFRRLISLNNFSRIFKIIFLTIFIWIIINLLNYSVFDNLKVTIMSIFRAFSITDDFEPIDNVFVRGGTFNIRLSYFEIVRDFLLYNPKSLIFGIPQNVIKFSINDIGIFALISKYGLIALIVIPFVILRPIVRLVSFFFSNHDLVVNKEIIKIVFALYIITLMSNLISLSLDGIIMMLPMWFIIFLAINIKKQKI